MNSETPPPIGAITICTKRCSQKLKSRVLRTVMRLMGPAQQGHTNMFFKFQSSKFVPEVEEAWPDVPWIYLFRDPLEVMASNLKVCHARSLLGGQHTIKQPNIRRSGEVAELDHLSTLTNFDATCIKIFSRSLHAHCLAHVIRGIERIQKENFLSCQYHHDAT